MLYWKKHMGGANPCDCGGEDRTDNLLGEDMFLKTSHHWRPMLMRMAEWRSLCLPAKVVPPCGNNKTAV